MKLWQFDIDDGTRVYSKVRPPSWTDEMRDAEFLDAPDEIAAEFEPAALEQFRREYGAPLHTVTVDRRCPGYKRNAQVA